MKHLLLLTVVSGALLGATAAQADAVVMASSAVKVEYVKPEGFSDVKDRQFKTAPGKNTNLKELKRWLEKEAAKHLQAGQQLELQFQDIDLAGDYIPGADPRLSDIRIVKDLYPPSVKLTFKLLGSDGAVVSEGERKLRDLGFMSRSGRMGSDGLANDKEMIKDWLRQEFPIK